MVRQGDQYAIPIIIKVGDLIITPDNCDDIRVQIGDVLKSYADGTLLYDSETQRYKFYLTEEMTRQTLKYYNIQVGIKQNDTLIYSDVKKIDLGFSIITKDWYEQNGSNS